MPLDTYASDVRLALFEAATQGDNQVVATNAADVLARGNALTPGLLVPAGLHPQWVRAQIGAAAATAIFAVTNCHDATVLAEFAHAETRVTVLRAIANSTYARAETQRFCEDRLDLAAAAPARGAARPFREVAEAANVAPVDVAPVPVDPADVPLGQRVPASLATHGFAVLNPASPLKDLPAALLSRKGPIKDITVLIERALTLDVTSATSSIVRGYYGPKDEFNAVTVRFWNAIPAHPLDLLGKLSKASQKAILELLLVEREEKDWVEPVNMWDLRLIERMVELKVTCLFPWESSRGGDFLTEEALPLVLATKRLHPLLYLIALTTQNVASILAATTGELRSSVTDHLEDATSEVLSAAICYEGPGNIHEWVKESSLDSIAYSLQSPNDPATFIAACLADPVELIDYLMAGLDFNLFNTTERFPPLEQVPTLAAKVIAAIPSLAELSDEVRSYNSISDMDPAYATVLMDTLPCAWEAMLKNHQTRLLVIKRIQEVTGLDVAMNRLFAHDELTPATLPEVLASLA